MSLLLVGISHRTAPVTLLDQIASQADSISALRKDIAVSPYVAEVMAVSTCNRLEVVADVTRFHGAVTDISSRLAKHSGVHIDELTTHLYVHFEERAVHHLFSVAAGLDSMIVGEQQILGQVRTALADAQTAGNAGRALNDLAQNSLRVGKRVHTDTGIDRHGASVVSVALDQAEAVMGFAGGRQALVVGAGAMSSLTLATLQSRGTMDVEVASRSSESSTRAAQAYGARAIPMGDVFDSLRSADLVVSATGATGVVISADEVREAMANRTDRPLVVVDLALPHDTEPEIADVPGVTRIDLAALADLPGAAAGHADLIAAKTIIDGEVLTFVAAQAAARVEPIVVSLRAKADLVLEAELQRLRLKQPGLSDAEIAAVEQTLRRTVSTLLHTPTVRMKQFAADPDGERYAQALHALFD
ncbi:MAG: glutamyl-tRNA reductase, partial [Actinobacteria bacterium]|nr:glutamyl-tRNA reductase [Actinomycetota bacterium]